MKSKIQNLSNLKIIGNNFCGFAAEIEDMSSLETILGDADFSLTKIDSLPNLRYVKGTFCPCDLKILPKLEILGSDAILKIL